VALSLTFDVRMGGQYASMFDYYSLSTGRAMDTLSGRDQAHGGLPYYIDASGNYVQLASHDAVAPNGSTVYHDGVILHGVRETFDGSGNVTGYVPNDKLVPEWLYYETNFDWKNQGIYPQIVYNNNYIKLRELALSFDLPAAWTRHIPARNLRLSLIGRNLFYLYKTLHNVDPESATSTVDYRQGLTDPDFPIHYGDWYWQVYENVAAWAQVSGTVNDVHMMQPVSDQWQNTWTDYYTKAAMDVREIRVIYDRLPADQKASYEVYLHLGKIVNAFTTARTTDLWGDIPYSEAFTARQTVGDRKSVVWERG